MAEVISFRPGGYRYIPAVFQYSSGVAAAPGFEIERVRFGKLLPLAEGFAAVEAHLAALGRPTTAFCACELRSKTPFTEAGFTAFNRDYVKTLARWGIFKDDVNPVARTNVCPIYGAPEVPSLLAFSYTVVAPASRAESFVIAGGGELGSGPGSYESRVTAYGDVSPGGMRKKINHVRDEMRRRLQALGFDWADASATQAYSVHDLGPFMAEELVAKGAAPAGITWHLARPPVIGLEFEMDVRRPAREIAR